MNSYLTSKISSFFVENIHNSQILRAISASNLDILDRNLLHPDRSEVAEVILGAYRNSAIHFRILPRARYSGK